MVLIVGSTLFKFLTVFLLIRCAHSDTETKSNVAFVIDDTASMGPVIEQVKEKAALMFKTIYESKTSMIGDFILITFNDFEDFDTKSYFMFNNFGIKAIKERIITRDSDTFLRELNSIVVSGGGECPELSLTGIQKAIEKCNPNSFIYVFTDASPRDHFLHKTIENLAQQKSIQIIFLLVTPTGYCSGKLDSNIYKQLANKTNGEIFLINENHVNKVIDYITHCMQSRQTPLVTVPIGPGTTKINFTGDNDMKNLSIKVNVPPKSSVNVNVTGPDGSETPTNDLINFPNTKVVTIPNPQTGPYVATVDTDGAGEASVKAAVSVDFTHGFSTFPPSSMKNTKTRPVPDEDSYLAIQLILTGTIDADVEIVTIVDINDKELMTMSATVVSETEKVFVTPPFKPPEEDFKIKVTAVDTKTGNKFNRTCRTPIQLQPHTPIRLKYKTPEVTITNRPEMDVKYGESIKLECTVKAYPKPNIVWEDALTGLQLPSKVYILELPYEYITYLEIKDITKDASYNCKAMSTHKSHKEIIIDEITLKTFRPPFLKVLEPPKDTKIDYEKDAKVYCKIDAWPPGYVTWYKDDKEISNDANFDISNDNTTLWIKNMQPELDGFYTCKARNEERTEDLEFTLTLSGVEFPEFDKTNIIETAAEGSTAVISCRIIKGLPSPKITWEFKKLNTNEFKSMTNIGQDLQIDTAKMDDAGIYRCHAKNIVGEDDHEILLSVQCIPEIDKSNSHIVVNQGDPTTIPCRIKKGIPAPDITWEFKQKDTSDFLVIAGTDESHVINSAELNNAGVYRCIAKNTIGEDSHATELVVQQSPEIDKSESTKTVDESSNIDIECSIIKGFPKPVITWTFKQKDANSFQSLSETDQVIHINSAVLQNAGVYKCEATNIIGKDFHEILLHVNCVPEIDHSKTVKTVTRGSKAVIACRITRGIPKPEISWKFRRNGMKDFIDMSETTQEIKINSANLINAGSYSCIAENVAGKDTHETELIVQYPPLIDKSTKTLKATKGTKAVIPCRILEGLPKPTITWEFKRQHASEFVSLLETGPEIRIDVVALDDSGDYKCFAKNILGDDSHKIELTVTNAPSVVVNKPIRVKVGETVTLTCDATGEPYPEVKWLRDDKTIETNVKYKIFSDHSLRFVGKIGDEGNYTCQAKNSLGEDLKNATLKIYGPIKIEPPKESPIYFDVGTDVELPCKAQGTPEPHIIWHFFSFDPSIKSKVFPSATEIFSIPKIQEDNAGYYRCVADNGYDEKAITYTVHINVPVEIEKPDQTEFNIVENDFVLRIPCKAKGNPKPKVSWIKNFEVLKMDDGYAMEEDGTLIIKNPTFGAAGNYLCLADNAKTHGFQHFTVNFTSVPPPSEPTETIYIEQDTTTEIDCKVPHKSTDTIRWYVGGVEMSLPTNHFILAHASIFDSGEYSCRVSSFHGSQSYHFKIDVGIKPYFENKRDNEVIISFIYGRCSFLDCLAQGKPPLTVTWYHDGIKLEETSAIYMIPKLNESHLGENRCEVKNNFGTITRSYVFKVTGCTINYIENESNKYHPVAVTKMGEVAKFENKNGEMVVPEGEPLDYLCPNSVRKAYCSKNEYILIDDTKPLEKRRIKYADLKCDSEMEPSMNKDRYPKPCSDDPSSRLVQIGYEFGGSFCAVYDVCFNNRIQKQYFIKYDLNRFASDIKIDNSPFINKYMYYNYEEMFNCYKQKHIAGEGCCFRGRQVVNPEDVAPGVQKTTYFNINVLPQWNSCGNNINLNEFDKRIRELAKSIRYKVEVYAGEFQSQMTFLRDRNGNRRFMPKYLWKVAQIREIGQALAIIMINVPNLTVKQALALSFCDDICDMVDWMQNFDWHNVYNGYVFCCRPWDFANTLSPMYHGLFEYNVILTKNI